MDMTALVTAYRKAIHIEELMDDLAAVAAVDRCQGSTGLDSIADHIAARAESAGLRVRVRRYQPGHQWWDFTAPQAASPIAAALHITGGPADDPVTAYPEIPCSLGRGSASTPSDGLIAPLVDLDRHHPSQLAGAFVLCPPTPRFQLAVLIDQLAASGAVGMAVQSPPRQTGGDSVVDRLEVPDDCPLVAFSVSAAQADRLRAAAAASGHVRVRARHAPAAPMPVVYAHRPGSGPVRGLLIAHLCHPAPGANDNASGVATLLAIAHAAARIFPEGTGPDLAFLWAPEMVGTAAYLHDHASHPHTRPDFAISIDMVGTPDSHLIIEQSPDHLPSPLAAAVEAAAHAISLPHHSYSGAVQLSTWPRAVVPFVGASDHLLFADRSIAIPAAHITRWPDPANHTSHDTLDRINTAELHRTAVATASAVTALSIGGNALQDIAATMHRLDAARVASALAGTVQPTRAGGEADILRHVYDAIEGAHARLRRWHRNTATANDPTGHLDALIRQLRRTHRRRSNLAQTREQVLVRRWRGPWNLNILRAALTGADQQHLGVFLGAGGPAYARFVGLAMAIDDRTSTERVIRRTVAATGLQIDTVEAHELIDLLQRAGWVERAP